MFKNCSHPGKFFFTFSGHWVAFRSKPLVQSYEKYGIKQLRIPTLDFHIPSAQSVEEAIQVCLQEARSGVKTLRHDTMQAIGASLGSLCVH